MKKNKDNIEYKSGWKRVIREGLEVNVSTSNKFESDFQSVSNICNNPNSPKKNIVKSKNTDTEKILSKIEDYKKEIDKKLDDLSDEINALISIILELNTQKDVKETTRIKRLFKNLGIK